MQDLKWVIKYDAIEYYEIVGIFDTKELAEEAMTKMSISYRFNCHIEGVIGNSIWNDWEETTNTFPDNTTKPSPQYPLLLDAGVLYNNINLESLNHINHGNTWK